MLRLQDLNNKNIRKVCIDSLETLFKDNCVSLDGKSALVSELTKKADGVFLWVHLAIKSIQRSHSNSDSLDELKRIHKLPSGILPVNVGTRQYRPRYL